MWVVVVEGSRFELDVLDEVPPLLPVRRRREEDGGGEDDERGEDGGDGE